MRTTVVLFTRDLRVHDNPTLAAAVAGADMVVPLFVLDPTIIAAANRHRFLAESLDDLRQSLRRRGGDLVIRRGDPVVEATRLARQVEASQIALAGDVSQYARRRERRLRDACDKQRWSLTVSPGLTVVPPGELRPGGGGPAYQVFTPYWRLWRQTSWRAVAPTPRKIKLPADLDPGQLPEPQVSGLSPNVVRGGEEHGRRRLNAWLRDLGGYADNHDLMAADRTSRLSPYLRFGCLSPLDVVQAALRTGADAAEDFIRQLCWRDFFYQVAAAFPKLRVRTVRSVEEGWRTDPAAVAAWREGRTGVPIVDAGMRQLTAEGWMHNRARLLVASFLTKHLGLDWRDGGDWFFDWLLDGDVPNNYGNWQWVAGTGNDTKPYRRFNPIRQAHRFDPDGDYVRRYVDELADIDGAAVHEPWKLPVCHRNGYPSPLEAPSGQSWFPPHA